MIKRPMLAGKVSDLKDIKYPVYCTPKLDGIRALKVNGNLVSRKFKPIPNNHIRKFFESILPDGVDGELILKNGKPCGAEFNKTSSAVMSEDGFPEVVYHVFDYVNGDLKVPYMKRMNLLAIAFQNIIPLYGGLVKLILPTKINNLPELLAYESAALSLGYEGIMLRSENGPYKEGRSSEREGYLLKLKRFEDGEAVIEGFEEQMSNQNTLEKDAFGHAKRSSHQAGKVPKNTLGKLEVRDCKDNTSFKVGTGIGLNDALRKEIWMNKEKYLGKIIKYKFQVCGMVDKPRIPIFLGFRSEDDM